MTEQLQTTKGHGWKLIHGDAFETLGSIWNNPIDFCFTSPSPYNLQSQSIGIGSELIVDDYIHNLIRLFEKVGNTLEFTGSLMVNMVDPYSPNKGSLFFLPEEFARMMLQRGWILNGKLIWQRPYSGNDPIHRRFRFDWEYIYWFSKNKNPYFNSYGAKYGSTSIFKYDRSGLGFPREILKMAIESCCPEQGIVLDPLCSTASTGEEALKLNRRFVGIEIIEEKYRIAEMNLRMAEETNT